VVVEYPDYFANENEGANVTIRNADPPTETETYTADEIQEPFQIGSIAGVDWVGDDDKEKIFGTNWFDGLFGRKGNDNIYGMEGADYLTGGDGMDSIFGGSGDDIIFTGYGS